MINFGIIGCGVIADFHAEAIMLLEDAALVGVSDVNAENAKSFAKKYSVKYYDSVDAMLLDKSIDAVCICTPSAFHKDGAISALEAGKHVVCEKPMAFTALQCREIENAVTKSGKLLTSVAQLRFSEDIIKVKELVKSGAFGKIVFCDLYMKYWRSPEYYSSSDWKGTLRFDGGGALMNQGIHGVDAMLYIMGDAKVINAINKTAFHDIEVEDASVSMLEFENGAMGVIEASTCAYPGFERKIEIMGTRGAVILKENKIEKLVIDGKTLIDGTDQKVAGTASDPTAMSCELHRRQIENLIGAIQGKNELVIDAVQGARAVKLIEEIYSKGNRM